VLTDFRKFCTVDLSLSESTAYDHLRQIRRFLNWIGEGEISTERIRDYLDSLKERAASTRANAVKAFRRFFRDFLGQGELVATFKMPRSEFKPKIVPTLEQLRRFYDALRTPRDRAIFLMFATTGLRRDEIVTLRVADIDFERRMVKPSVVDSSTKRRWASFYNGECEVVLREHLAQRADVGPDSKLFSGGRQVNRVFKRASKASGIKVTPQILRDWFACEMGELGVADRYVDAFCGRIPRSVLARHYTDFSPERLKRIYDGAGLRVLG